MVLTVIFSILLAGACGACGRRVVGVGNGFIVIQAYDPVAARAFRAAIVHKIHRPIELWRFLHAAPRFFMQLAALWL